MAMLTLTQCMRYQNTNKKQVRLHCPIDIYTESALVLTPARQLINLKIPEGTYQLELHLDPSLNDVPVFRMPAL
ncbi:hypothetical protein EMCG_05522 [[Emmonsia] crescens]|uniref:Uncharacterized protein n=1 Tax=[Emmonsia] crescens TaxID=73230 RepID=A0A0G2HNH5_9EURO|nr:hypothetical protein EMCG_05522 [Emmonsia crescens UAMH 3008]